MRSLTRAVLTIAAASLLLAFALAEAGHAQDRYAIVIGVEDVPQPIGASVGAAGDARAVTEALEARGFSVRRLIDPDQGRIKRATYWLADQLSQAPGPAIGLVYFAGHGVQVNGRTYLFGTDARAVSSLNLSGTALAADFFTEQLSDFDHQVVIVIDAIAPASLLDDPFFDLTPGLRPFDPPAGGAVILSNLPDQRTGPRMSAPSVFARSFIDTIISADTTFSSALDRLVADMRNMTGGARTPWIRNDTPATFSLSPTMRGGFARRDTPSASRGIGAPPPVADRGSRPRSITAPVEEAVIIEEQANEIHEVRVFFGTDRVLDYSDREPRFTNRDSPLLTFGVADVTLPPNHKPGEIETPRWWRFEFTADPEKHVVFEGFEVRDENTFFAEVRRAVAESNGRQAFVFVHGFNTSFRAAAMRTAQLHHDLKFDGAPIFYSWPSRGSALAYAADATAADRTVRRLKEFLLLVSARTGARKIHLIGHSMGNRAMVKALEEIGEDLRSDGRDAPFNEIIMSAPDIDRTEFVELAEEILPTA
ncbi:MAG: alpha/beta fold hydrolase, partial [Caulobacterales bacterium]|nr:alpha/beta fold hydrolase [Caulobacterales bacterium]